MLKKDKLPRIKDLIFQKIFLYNTIFFIIILCFVAYISFKYVLEERGSARVELLQQISESVEDNRNIMVSVMNHTYDLIYPMLELPMDKQGESIQNALFDIQSKIDTFQFDYSVDVVFNNKEQYSSRPSDNIKLKTIMQSYWYIKHFSGESDVSWSLRFKDIKNLDSYQLSYARTLYDENNKTIGVIIVNTAPTTFFHIYQNLVKENNTIYILDQNGVVISHSNVNMIGVWLYHIENFRSQYDYNSYTIKKKLDQNTLISNYYDQSSGWIFVEEYPLEDFILSYGRIVLVMLAAIIIMFLLIIIRSYKTTKYISEPLIDSSQKMLLVQDDRLTHIPLQNQYYEIFVLSVRYNSMVNRIRNLINTIKAKEREKSKLEFDFLQAQINPHFLRNTLVGIKSLIITGSKEQAVSMLSAFIKLLNTPLYTEQELHTLKDEVEYIRNYIALMQHRYGRDFHYLVNIGKDLENFMIPRMILQPLVENAIFYGISEIEEEEGLIKILAYYSGTDIHIIVENNGKSITQEQIDKIWQPDEKNRRSINSIGLNNVLRRLKHVFGEETSIRIQQREFGGTIVRIIISQGGKDLC